MAIRDFSKDTLNPPLDPEGEDIDKRVNASLQQRSMEIAMKERPTMRERKERAARKKRDAKRLSGRIALDFPVEVKEQFMKQSERLGIPVSQIILWCAFAGLKEIKDTNGECLEQYYLPTKTGLWQHNLDLKKREKELK